MAADSKHSSSSSSSASAAALSTDLPTAKDMWAVRKLKPTVGFELVRTPIPAPSDTEVLMKVLAVSLCGTDVHVCEWDPPFSAGRLTPPITTGHEVCGLIIQCGKQVTEPKVGDLVSAESHLPCKSQPRRKGLKPCYMCQTGNEHICEFVQFFSVDIDGFMAEYGMPACVACRMS